MMPLNATLMLVLLVLTAAWYDVRFRKIPNWLNVGGLLFALVFGGLQGIGSLKLACLGALCALAVYIPLYLLRGMGAGDVKLMVAIGALTGPGNWIMIFLLTAILGGVASAILVVYRRAGRQTFHNVAIIVDDLIHGRAPAQRTPEFDIRNKKALRLPHGAAIAAGCLLFTASQKFR